MFPSIFDGSSRAIVSAIAVDRGGRDERGAEDYVRRKLTDLISVWRLEEDYEATVGVEIV